MTKDLSIVALITSFGLVSGALMHAQEKPAPPQTPGRAPVITPLKIQVVISRYQGDKRISSLPYTLSVNTTHTGEGKPDPAGRANLRMGAKIPVMMMMMATPPPDSKAPQVGPVQYQDVGTNIDCNVWPLEDGRFRAEITIDDTSVYTDDKESGPGMKANPSFRSFRVNDSMILKDGGTAQFTTATDKVSGEIVKVDVTLTVVK